MSATLDRESFGEQYGPLRPDYGPGWADLRCVTCGATWTGHIGEDCGWCDRRLELTRQYQAELLRDFELPDIDDIRRPAALEAWAQRLTVAVEAGTITADQARMWAERKV